MEKGTLKNYTKWVDVKEKMLLGTRTYGLKTREKSSFQKQKQMSLEVLPSYILFPESCLSVSLWMYICLSE